MLSAKALQSLVEEYAKTKDGKQKIADCLDEVRRTGKPLAGGGAVISTDDMSKAASAFIEILKQKLPESIASVGETLRASEPKEKPNGEYEVIVSFDKDALHRDSLENDLGYDGIDNIVALFNNGYHAKNYVYGWWNDHAATGEALSRWLPGQDFAWVRSKKEREALLFMQEAANDFNSLYGEKYNVTVQLGSDYKE